MLVSNNKAKGVVVDIRKTGPLYDFEQTNIYWQSRGPRRWNIQMTI